MVRLYPQGECIKDYVADARWKSLSIISALRSDSSTEAMVYEGGLTGELAKTWLDECLLKTLKRTAF